jgi:hypothetical protein
LINYIIEYHIVNWEARWLFEVFHSSWVEFEIWVSPPQFSNQINGTHIPIFISHYMKMKLMGHEKQTDVLTWTLTVWLFDQVGLKGEIWSLHSLMGSSSVEWIQGSFVAQKQPLTWYKVDYLSMLFTFLISMTLDFLISYHKNNLEFLTPN